LDTSADQRLDRHSTGTDMDKIDAETASVKRTALLGHPNSRHAGTNGSVGEGNFFFAGLGAVGVKRK